MTNIIVADLSKSKLHQCQPVYRYSYGMKLKIVGIDIPTGYTVRYSNDINGIAKSRVGGSDGIVDIPDEYFVPGENIYCWPFVHPTPDSGTAVATIVIPIDPEAKCVDEEPTPVQQSVIDEAISALNAAVDHVDEAVQHYPIIQEGIWYVWDIDSEEYVSTDIPATGPKGDPGDPGPGVPEGGTTSQMMVKHSDDDYDTEWQDQVVVRGEGIGAIKTVGPTNYPNEASGKGSLAEGLKTTASGTASHSEGAGTKAIGNYSHAEGQYTFAFGAYAHAEGQYSVANGSSSHVEGAGVYGLVINITGDENSTEYVVKRPIPIISQYVGHYALVSSINKINKIINYNNGILTFENTFGEALNEARIIIVINRATGVSSHAEGNNTITSGESSHAEGLGTKASGSSAHAEGTGSEAKGDDSHAEGQGTIASGNSQHAQGNFNIEDSSGVYADIIGNGTDSNHRSNAATVDWSGNAWYAGKVSAGTPQSPANPTATNDLTTKAYVDDAISHIDNMHIHICTAQEYDSETGVPTVQNPDTQTFYLVPGGESGNVYVEWMYVDNSWERFGSATIDLSGYATKADTVLDTTLSRGRRENTTVGTGSFAFGNSVEASGNYSHAEGSVTRASGNMSHAEGVGSRAIGHCSHAEGYSTIANGEYSHVSGLYNVADSYDSWPEWVANTSYTVGDKVKVTTTVDDRTTVTGYVCKTANSDSEFIASKWTEDEKYNYIEIVGNGTFVTSRSNARALTWEGDERLAGDVYVGCNADSTGGTKLAKITDIPSVQEGLEVVRLI